MAKFENLRKGEVTLAELIEIEDLKYDFNKNLLALARVKVCGKSDPPLEAKVSEQRALLKEAGDLRKKFGVSDLSPRDDELRRLTKEFKETKDDSVLGKIDAIVFDVHQKKNLIAQKVFTLSRGKGKNTASEKAPEAKPAPEALAAPQPKSQPLPAPSLPQIEGLLVRVIHGRRAEYVLEDDAARFDENESSIKKSNDDLQGWRLKGDLPKCRELEKVLSGLIEKREYFISRSDKIISNVQSHGLLLQEPEAEPGIRSKEAKELAEEVQV